MNLIISLAILVVCIYYDRVNAEHKWSPKYHIAPKKGWMNDPNGLIYHKGYYHAFFQYTPDDVKAGLMHWGHVRSENMLTWEQLDIALTPSLPDDLGGIFSGSAVEKDGNITVIYTGVSKDGKHQRQIAAVSKDDKSFEKIGVIITKDKDDSNFRDPKVWQQNNTWFAVIGSKTDDNKGQVLLYKSKDFKTWSYDRMLAQSDGKLGYMWECPDFFSLGGKQVLVISPQGIKTEGFNYQNLYQSGYFVGSWSPDNNFEVEKNFREIDHGHDFYAPQTFLAKDGRRIMIGWLSMWKSQFPEANDGWAGMQTIPRELTLTKTGHLNVRPIREVEVVRKARTTLKKHSLMNSSDYFAKMEKNIINSEALVIFHLSKTTAEQFGIELVSEHSSEEGVRVYVHRSESRLYLERNYPQHKIEKSSRSVAVNLTLPTLSLDMFFDGSSIEVFVNEGDAVLSSRIYPEDDQRNLYLFGDNLNVSLSFIVWDIE